VTTWTNYNKESTFTYMFRVQCLVAATLVTFASVAANAADKLYITVTPGKSIGHYDKAPYRDYADVSNINLVGTVINQWGFALGYENTIIHYKVDIPAYQQDAIFLSGHVSNAPQQPLGIFTTRLDLHCVRDRDNPSAADNACAIAPQISYMHYDNSLYVDFGYAISDYETNPLTPGPLRIEQWTPTLGVALNSSATHWLRLRGYFIHSSNPERTHQINQTNALEFKYLYYPVSQYKTVPAYIDISVVSGERIYAVDRDTASINNLADLETGAQSISSLWRMSQSIGVMISASHSQFKIPSQFGNSRYSLNSTWLGLVAHW